MIAGVERGTTKDRRSACQQKVVSTQACWPTQLELIPVSIVGVLSLPPRWDVTRLSWQLASTHVYSWEERERHCESEVFCLRTQHARWPSLVSNPDLSTRSVPLTMRPVPQATHPIHFHLVALKRHGLIFKCFQTICLPDWMWQELGFWRCC